MIQLVKHSSDFGSAGNARFSQVRPSISAEPAVCGQLQAEPASPKCRFGPVFNIDFDFAGVWAAAAPQQGGMAGAAAPPE